MAVAIAADPTRSALDLAEDLDELRFLAASAAGRLETALSELRTARSHLAPRAGAEVAGRCREELARLRRQVGELAHLGAAAEAAPTDVLAAERAEHAELLRSRLGLVAALVTATDWQSPSFGHSCRSAAGRQTGLVAPHDTDYKRDRHLDAAAYERAYVRELVDPRADTGASALLTACGMAAFTTILSFLLHEEALRHRYVVVGRGVYHETKQLLYGAIPAQVVEMDEAMPRSIELAVERFRPAAVFFDLVSNTRENAVVDLARLLDSLAGLEESVYLVLDVTGSSVAAVPPEALEASGPVRLLLFESLLKYAQFGLDRTNAGVLVAWGQDAEALSAYREHLGTNIPDVAVPVLPPPSRPRLLRRLARLERNAVTIAGRLHEELEGSERRVVAGVVHPRLDGHPCGRAAARLPFAGGCVALRFAAGHDTPEWRGRFLEAALDRARQRCVPLVAGASFGFDVTRIYVTAAAAAQNAPFVRIAAGAEHADAADRVAEVLAETVRAIEAAA